MTGDLNKALSKLALVARKKNGKNMVFLDSHELEKERRGQLGPQQGKAGCKPLPVEHFRNSMKCAAWGLSRPSTWLCN